MFLSAFLAYAMRVNLSVSIIAMVKSSARNAANGGGNINNITSSNTCRPDDQNFTQMRKDSLTEVLQKVEGEFNWDENQQAALLYSFFAGYILTQIPGGHIAEVVSVTRILGAGVGLTALLTCLTSFAARFNYYALIALRVAEGITEGVTFPAIFAILARWSPVSEQTLLVNVVTVGTVIGTIVALPVAGMLCTSSLGWPASFYVFGAIGFLWVVVWLCVATDSPEDHPWISNDEQQYIVETRSSSFNEKRPPMPWRRILLSPAVLCVGLTKLAGSFNYYMILTELPSYLNAMFTIDITQNGYINAGMNLGLGTTLVITALITDKLIERNVLNKTLLRKLFVACSTIIPSICMCLLQLLGCRYDLIVTTLFINYIFLGFSGGGDAAMALDIAPRFAGPIAGVVNTIANIAGLLAPKLVGTLTENDNTLTQWNLVFLYTGIFTTVGSVIFLIFGTAEQQSWAVETASDDDLHPGILQLRFFLCFLIFIAMFLVYAMRCNLSVAILAMNDSAAGSSASITSNDTCRPQKHNVHHHKNSSATKGWRESREFHWDEDQQATVLTSFFIGYVITQVPGGYLAEVASVTWVFGTGVGLTSLLACLTAPAARFSYYALVALLVGEGITEGVTLPAAFSFLARWSPKNEQNRLVNIFTIGAVTGTTVTLPVSAMLSASPLSWPAAFYIFGGAGLIWTVIWFCVATDFPEKHPWISPEEREYILNSRSSTYNEGHLPVPWSRILLSPAVLCLGITKLASTLNYYMIITELPTYLNDMFAIDIINNGWVTGGMNLALAIVLIITGSISDKVIERNIVNKTLLRKFFVFCSTLLPSLCMFLLTTYGCRYDLISATLLVNCIFIGFSGGGDAPMPLDIAPRFTGTVAGLTNMMANVAGLLAPKLVGILTKNNNTFTQWNRVFLYTGIFTTVGAVIFLIFGTAEAQSWATEKKTDEGTGAANHPNRDTLTDHFNIAIRDIAN
ncbi:sialin-like [Tropilaelaps mercedesae]|uniref:Sialin-like n=1 Tax=Tropilaelaps mercedesae TaxID=418985 RepID=A0A1V9XRZ0_9ACAR|nr:sialin-like [Tropilaelaps mercedesae]